MLCPVCSTQSYSAKSFPNYHYSLVTTADDGEQLNLNPNLFNSHYFSKRLIQCAELVNFDCNYGLNYDSSSPDNKKHGTNNLKRKHLNVYHGSNFYVSDHICGPQEFRWQLKMHSHIM